MSAHVKIEGLEDRTLMSASNLVLDVDPAFPGANPQNLMPLGNLTVFTADTTDNVRSLWVTDGTPAGTHLLNNQLAMGDGYSDEFEAIGNTLYFVGDDVAHGQEIWKTDGTVQGTKVMTDFSVDGSVTSSAYNFHDLVNLNGMLIFAATPRGGHQEALWRSDGTAAGTVKLADVRVAQGPNGVVFNGKYYFAAVNTSLTLVNELWVTDGTAEGTHRAIDPSAGPGSNETNSVGGVTVVGGKLYVVTASAGVGGAIYTSDGTTGGTQLVRSFDILTGVQTSPLLDINGELYFGVGIYHPFGNHIWKTDGTAEGTVPVPEGAMGAMELDAYIGSIGDEMLLLGSRVAPGGRNLWASDGGDDGPVLLHSFVNSEGGVGRVGDTIYFLADDGSGMNIWQTDGTAAGTHLAGATLPAQVAMNTATYTWDDGRLLFVINTVAHGQQLFAYDPASNEVNALPDSSAVGTFNSNPISLGVVGGFLYFLAKDSTGVLQLWRTDGTSAGTALLKGYTTNTALSNKSDIKPILYEVGGAAYLYYAKGWYSVSAQAITRSADWPGPGSAPTVPVPVPTNSITIGQTRYYASDDGFHGSELWIDDGTGARMLEDLNPGSASSSPDGFSIINGKLIFAATTPQTGRELNVIDTSSPLPVSPPPASPPPSSPPPSSPPPPPSSPPPPAATPSVVGSFSVLKNHVLRVDGTTGNDRITVRHKPGDPNTLEVIRNGKVNQFVFSDVNKINVAGSNGHDWISLIDVDIASIISGGNGNDSVYGSQGADSIDGGRGDDYLCGMAGDDSITGGVGHDLIRGGEGIDRLFANKGSDDLNKNKGDTIVNDVLG